jgi:hypothetical protein
MVRFICLEIRTTGVLAFEMRFQLPMVFFRPSRALFSFCWSLPLQIVSSCFETTDAITKYKAGGAHVPLDQG